MPTSCLKSTRRHRDHDNQTRDNERRSHDGNDDDAAPRRRKLASDHIVLAFKIPMKAQQEDQDRYAQKCRPERFPHRLELAGIDLGS